MSDIIGRLSIVLAARYHVEREIGKGGMATVYLARNVRHERKVAIKVLRPELAARLGSERFVQEIKVTANLQHPNILPLYELRRGRRVPLLCDAIRGGRVAPREDRSRPAAERGGNDRNRQGGRRRARLRA